MQKQSERQNAFLSQEIKDSWQHITNALRITLLTHSRPDGDGVSSCLALELILTRLGKEVETVYPNAPEFEYKRQARNFFINSHSQSPELLISLDTANYDRLYFPDEFRAVPLINIDHHVSNSIDGVCNFIDPVASSASEVLYTLVSSWCPDKIDASVAQALLSGILSDSRIFHTQSTSASTLRISADLIDKGADLYQQTLELLANKSPDIIKLWGSMLSRVTVSREKKAAWSFITQDDLKKFGLTLSSLVGFVNFLADIAGVDVTILFYETKEGDTKVSLRSREYDVNEFASKFGGGGHKNAAGILVKEPIIVVIKKVTEAL